MILGYIHVAVLGNWRRILGELIHNLRDSGLKLATDQIMLSIVGGNAAIIDSVREVYGEDGVSLVWAAKDVRSGEYPTLEAVYNDVQRASRDYAVWYMHTKGVSYYGTELESRVYDWFRLMSYFNIQQWKESLQWLDGYDVCGVNWRQKPWPHFSGNFWWASSSYIRKLQSPDAARGICDIGERFGAEAWIGTGNPRVHCLHNSGINHYQANYPSSRYRSD